ncbi:MAG: thiamine ABC transporter substrate binding subunit [Actinomycetes bacterium]
MNVVYPSSGGPSVQGTLRRIVAVGVTVVATLAVAACADSGSNAGDEPSSGGAATDREVVLVTYDAYALPSAAADAFTKATGARIKVVANGDSGAMLSSALLSAGAPQGDVIFGIDNLSASTALQGDLLSPAPRVSARIDRRYQLAGRGASRLVPVDTGDVCVNIDAAWFQRNGVAPPTSLEQLADPAYRNLTVVESPVTSSPGLALLAGTIGRFGESEAFEFWSKLRDNGVRVRPSWDDAYFTDYTVSGGDRPLVLSYATSPPAEVLLSECKRSSPQSTVLVDSCASQVEYAGVLRGARHPELAWKLVAFMQTTAWQRELPASNFVLPVVDGVPLPSAFRQWVPPVPRPMSVAPATVAARRDAWLEQWRNLFE